MLPVRYIIIRGADDNINTPRIGNILATSCFNFGFHLGIFNRWVLLACAPDQPTRNVCVVAECGIRVYVSMIWNCHHHSEKCLALTMPHIRANIRTFSAIPTLKVKWNNVFRFSLRWFCGILCAKKCSEKL